MNCMLRFPGGKVLKTKERSYEFRGVKIFKNMVNNFFRTPPLPFRLPSTPRDPVDILTFNLCPRDLNALQSINQSDMFIKYRDTNRNLNRL